MKKTIFRILLSMVTLLVFWVLAHRFDTEPNPELFTRKDIPAASFDRSNGFYILWGLSEPPETDITSAEFSEKYRQMFDPRFDNEKYIMAFDFEASKKKYARYRESFKKLDLRSGPDSTSSKEDWCQEVLTKKSLLAPLAPDLQVQYKRFRMMMDSKVFEDFIAIDADAPLPNLVIWLHAAKLYTAVNVLTALEGDWETGVSNLLDMVDFGKLAVKRSRFLIVNLISKAILALPLQAVASLMNQKECPVAVYEMVLRRMPPIKYEEYGTRKSLICEVVAFNFDFIDKPWHDNPYRPYSFWERLPIKLLLLKNQTRNYADQLIKQFIELEQTPPYQWQSDKIALKPIKTGPFWGLWNGGGKILLAAYNDYASAYKNGEGIYTVIFKTNQKKALYDMVKISAELHLKYNLDKPVQEILNGLDSYKVTDHSSGKPYIWNEDKQVLYSIGSDRIDGGGSQNMETTRTDIVLPCVLYIRGKVDHKKNR